MEKNETVQLSALKIWNKREPAPLSRFFDLTCILYVACFLLQVASSSEQASKQAIKRLPLHRHRPRVRLFVRAKMPKIQIIEIIWKSKSKNPPKFKVPVHSMLLISLPVVSLLKFNHQSCINQMPVDGLNLAR